MASVIYSGATTPTSDETQDFAAASNVQQLDSQTLQVTPRPEVATRFRRTILTLHGNLPRDEPLEPDVMYQAKDLRSMEPLSIRYRAQEDDIPVGDGRWQDGVAAAIWARLQALSPHLAADSTRPAVVFDEDADEVQYAAPCIIILFEDPIGFAAARDGLKVIKVDHQTDEPITYEQDNWANTLGGSILPVDILRFPIDQAVLPDFFTALQDLAAPLGDVLGAGLICVQSGAPHEAPSSAHIIRFYVHLFPLTMMITQQSFIQRLRTSFMWQGVGYTMMFPGKKGGEPSRSSAHYPLETPAGVAAGQPAAAL